MMLSATERRVCEIRGCSTILSRFNTRSVCAPCERGDRSWVPPEPPKFAPRAPAPARPTLEGAIEPPAPVKIRERSYAEMMRIEKPPPPPTPRRVEVEKVEPRKEARPTRGAGRPGQRGGSTRTFDYAEAARLMGELRSYKAVAEAMGVSHTAACTAVKAELGEEAANALVDASLKVRRKFDHDEAVRLFLELRNLAEVARLLGVSHGAVHDAVVNALGREKYKALAGRNQVVGKCQCKVEGCVEMAVSIYGHHGRLCVEHKRLAKLAAKGVKVTKVTAAEVHAEIDRIEHELDEIAGLISQADEAAA